MPGAWKVRPAPPTVRKRRAHGWDFPQKCTLTPVLAEFAAYGAEQLVEIEGLEQHVHALAQEALPVLRVLRVAGDEQYRHLRMALAHAIGQLATADARQADVGQQQVELAPLDRLQRLARIGAVHHLVA